MKSKKQARIWARLCALALIAAMLLTSAYAGGAVESGLAVDSLAAENPATENPATQNLATQNLAQQNTVPAEGTAAALALASTNATEEPPTAAPSAPTSAQAATQSTAAPSQPATQAPNRAPQAAASLAEEPLYTLVLGADKIENVTAFYPNENTDQSNNSQWGVAGLYYDAQHNAHVLLVHNINNLSGGESKLGTFSVNNQAFDKDKYSYKLTSTSFNTILFQNAAGDTLETLAPKLNNKAPSGYFDVNVGNIQIGESFTVGLDTGSPGWNIEGLQVDLDLSYTLTKTVAKGTSAAEGVAFTESVSVERGDWVIYKITVKNTGKLPLQNMILTDLLPQDVFVEGSVQMGVGEEDGSIPDWTLFNGGTLFDQYNSPGEFTRDIYIKAQVKPDLAIDTATEYVNTAKIDGMDMPTLEDTAKITVNPPKKGTLRVSKAVTSENPMDPAPDTSFEFTLTYEGKTESFALKSGESTEFEIPANAAFSVTETAAAGYTTKVNSTPGASFTGTMPVNGALVAAFENQFSARTISLNIKKVDENTKDPLADARFELREAVVDGDTWSDQANGKIYYPDGDKNFLTSSDGKATFNDIPFGNYLLYETKAPAGYKLPKDPVRVTVKAGMVTLMNVSGDKIGEVVLPTEGESTSQPDVTIPNKENDKLPVAGGAGTLWFTGGGLALAGAAALLYFKQRRKKGEE